jgi:hypothetical protein
MGVLYSSPGIGKTSLSFTANEPLLLAFEKGVERSYADGRKDFISYDTWKEVKDDIHSGELVTTIQEGSYKTIIIDTAGTCIQNQITNFILKQGGRLTTKNQSALSMDGWGVASAEFKLMLDTIVNLGVDVICIAHDKGDGKETKTELDVQGSAKGIITKNADFIAYLYADGSGQRWLDFNGSEDRIGKNPARFERTKVPFCSTEGEYPVFMTKVVATTKAAMFGKTQAQKDAEAKLTALKEKVVKAKSNEDFNALFVTTDELPTSFKLAAVKIITEALSKWYNEKVLGGVKEASDLNLVVSEFKEFSDQYRDEVKATVRSAISNKAKALKLSYNKDAAAYEDPATNETETEAAE